MSEENASGSNNAIDEKFLDSCAEGFANPTPRPRTTDDELDELMTVADQKAAQKAATEFQAMLKQMVDFQEKNLEERNAVGETATEGTEKSPDDLMMEKMLESMKTLMSSTGQVANASSPEEFQQSLEQLRAPESEMEPFMEMIMHSLISKEVMYQPLKDMYEKYPQYLEENKDKLSAEDASRYEKQCKVLGKLCVEFEKMPDAPVENCEGSSISESAATAESPLTGIPAAEQAEEDAHTFEKLAMLLVELQSYGYPPKELTGEMPEGMVVDPETGLPSFTQSPAGDACSIM